jgi:putative AlgH/UPF0301 family transcriptional regulator
LDPDPENQTSAGTVVSSDTERSTTIKSTTTITGRRPFSLLQAINPDDLPETLAMAFGDSPIREGGPVNMSLQMIHRKTTDMKSDDYNPNTKGLEKKEQGPSTEIGGTLLGVDHDDDEPKDAEEIYSGGDAIKASYAVLDGRSDRDDFSFVIGASCWAPGQLEEEIERGCWLPFRGPPNMTMTGMVDHTIPSSENCDDSGKGTKLSPFPPRLSNTAISSVAGSAAKTSPQQSVTPRPVGDLWLSIMCALGEGESDLAYMMLDSKSAVHELGDACDNFNR